MSALNVSFNEKPQFSCVLLCNMKHFNISVFGKVQGVFYRASTKAVADQLGVKGYVINKPDGSVYIEAEADSIVLEMFIDWCSEGPEEAEVTDVSKEEGEIKGYSDFEVLKRPIIK